MEAPSRAVLTADLKVVDFAVDGENDVAIARLERLRARLGDDNGKALVPKRVAAWRGQRERIEAGVRGRKRRQRKVENGATRAATRAERNEMKRGDQNMRVSDFNTVMWLFIKGSGARRQPRQQRLANEGERTGSGVTAQIRAKKSHSAFGRQGQQ